MLFDNKSTNDVSSVPLLLCSDMSKGVNVERNDTKLNRKHEISFDKHFYGYFAYLVENFGSFCTKNGKFNPPVTTSVPDSDPDIMELGVSKCNTCENPASSL